VQDLSKGLLAALVATIVLSVLIIMKDMMGIMPALHPPKMIAGLMGVPNASVFGWVAHFMIGVGLYGFAIAVFARRRRGRNHLARGIWLAILGWTVMMVAIMPMVGAGLFGLALGVMAPVMTLVLHLIFGAVLGWVYGRTVERSESIVIGRSW
jgi:hypothetical protein